MRLPLRSRSFQGCYNVEKYAVATETIKHLWQQLSLARCEPLKSYFDDVAEPACYETATPKRRRRNRVSKFRAVSASTSDISVNLTTLTRRVHRTSRSLTDEMRLC